MTIQQRARKWVNGYAATGAALVVGVCHIPGQATAICASLETFMCLQIGRMYLGSSYGPQDAAAAAMAIGLTTVSGQIIALEATSLMGPLGWPLKAPLAATLIKALGELVIVYYESVKEVSA